MAKYLRPLEAAIVSLGTLWILISLLTCFASLWAWWTIYRKAGYWGGWSLLLWVPILNVVSLCWLAFGEWPIERKRAARRRRRRTVEQRTTSRRRYMA